MRGALVVQVVGHGLEDEDGVDAANPDACGDVRDDGGVVEHGSDAGLDQFVGDFLGAVGGNGEDADLDGSGSNDRAEPGERVDRDVSDLSAGDARVGVERCDDTYALGGEAGVGGDGAAEASDADECGVPHLVDAEDSPELGGEMPYVVASPLASEASEVAEVLAYLCGGHAEAGAELFGAGNVDAAGLHLGEDSDVGGEPLHDHFGREVRHAIAGVRGSLTTTTWRHFRLRDGKGAGNRRRPASGWCVPFIT